MIPIKIRRDGVTRSVSSQVGGNLFSGAVGEGVVWLSEQDGGEGNYRVLIISLDIPQENAGFCLSSGGQNGCDMRYS